MSMVLIVDDQAIIREPIEAALRRAGMETSTATNGAEALASLAQRLPDLVLLDIGMPVMDGLTLLRSIRANPATRPVPVVMLTAQADKAKIIEAAKLGVKGYLLKSSFSLKDMLIQVQRVLGETSGATASGAPVAGKNSSHATPAQAGAAATSSTAATAAKTPAAAMPAAQVATAPSSVAASAAPAAVQSVGDAPGNQVDALRSIRALMPKSAVADAVEKSGELKGFSPAVAEVLKLTGNARCSIEHVAKAISRDHAIALKVLRLSNSAVYTRGEPVDSVLKGVLRIGLGQIRQAVMNIAVMERFSSVSLGGVIDANQFWEHAIATGIISAEIAHSRSEKEADSAFTIGLLHDIGRLAFAEQLGDTYKQVLETARQLQLPLEQVEHRMLGTTHADMMDRMFRKWKFAKEFINPIVFHHLSAGNIRDAAPQETMQIATLALANRLAHSFMLGSSGNETVYPTEDLCELLRLEPGVIARIEQIARDETEKVKFALLAASNGANWPQLRETHRSRLTTPLRPLYVSAEPACDACRIFCDQLADRGEGEAPNIAIMHIRSVKERAALSTRMREMEQAQGLAGANLPLIAFSPAGKIAPEPSLCAGRRVENLTIPFAIDRFIATANTLLAGASELQAAA
jgi:HD-like signal output (HDOD) protein/DNA-binding response OmpR family regulator